jgi:hypothetical protein
VSVWKLKYGMRAGRETSEREDEEDSREKLRYGYL